MESISEVLIVSDSGKQDANCTMYDLHTGSLLESYKEGHSARNGLDFIGNDYLISAFEDKAKIKIWQIGQPSVCRKMTSPGIVSAIAVSKCGHYCIAGIGKAIYIWEIASGNLESHLEYHHHDITCVRFSSDGSFFITGGKDGMVFVFFLTDAIMSQDSVVDHPRPHFIWSDHAAEISDIYVGYVSFYSRVATVSKDETCMIYELDTGFHLCTIRVDVPLTTVTMDMCEYFLFLGSIEGEIFRINLFETSEAEIHFEDVEKKNVFVGHKKQITSLCVSECGKYLISGSADKECRIWDITNFSCFRKQIFTGPVTNVITSTVPPGIKNKRHVPRLITGDFKRIFSDEDTEEIPTTISNQKLSLFHAGVPDQFFDSEVLNCSTERLEKMLVRGSMTLDDMSRINHQIYSFSLNDIFDKACRQEEESNSSN